MASFLKNLQKFFVYFFTGVSVIVVVLGIQRVKQGDNLAATAPADGANTGNNSESAAGATRVAGVSQAITANGKTFQTPWGNLTTKIIVKDGKVTSVEIPELPDSPPSIQAKAYLIDQVLRSGGADIQGVTGATITSRAFKASLESALALAKAQGAELAVSSQTTTQSTAPSVDTQTTTRAPETTPTQTTTAPSASTTGVSGTFTGNAYQTPWGNAVASVTFTNGKITGVTMPQVPNSPPSIEAKPYLISQALAAGSANIQGVSGATYASIAFKSSLESAIAKASAQGTVATPKPSTTASGAAPTPKPSISKTYDDDEDDDEDEYREHRDRHDDDEWDD